MNRTRLAASTLTAAILLSLAALRAQELKPTVHPRLPAQASDYWLAPGSAETRAAKAPAIVQLQEAIKQEIDSNDAKALAILTQPAVQQGALGNYASYYQGLAELRLGRYADAIQTFQALLAKNPVGFLVEGATLRLGEADEAQGDQQAALAVYDRLSKTTTTAPGCVSATASPTARSSTPRIS